MGRKWEINPLTTEPETRSRPPRSFPNQVYGIQTFGDLLAVSVLAVFAAIIAGSALNQYRWLAIFGSLLALVLPGYALSVAVLLDLRRLERLLCSLGLSLVVDVLGGLVLYVTPWGLRPLSWAVMLAGAVVVGSLCAGVRRYLAPADPPPAWPKLDRKSLIGFELGVAILIGAVSVALLVAQQRGERFTQLWAVPAATEGSLTIQIGVSNKEDALVGYSLLVQSNSQPIAEWQNIELSPDETWATQLTLPIAPNMPIQVLLFRHDEPNQTYRMVQLSPATWQMSALSTDGR